MMTNHLLKQRRENLGIRQSEMAQRLGVSKSVYSRVEGGEHLPTLRLAALVERELGIPASSWVEIEARTQWAAS